MRVEGTVGNRPDHDVPQDGDPREKDSGNEAPELPPDEPAPAPIEEPPDAGDDGPYVVQPEIGG